MNKTLWMGILFVILLSATVFAVPPSQTVQVTQSTDTLSIEYPKIEWFHYNGSEPIILNFHVYNMTGSPMDNTSCSCSIHLYNDEGSHVYRNNSLNFNFTNDYAGDYYLVVPPSLLERNQQMAYVVSCNTSIGKGFKNGFVSASFYLSDTGYEVIPEKRDWKMPVMVFSLTMTIIFMLFAFYYGNKNNESNNWMKIIMKYFNIIMALIMMLVSLNGIRLILADANQVAMGITTQTTALMSVFNSVYVGNMVYFMFFILMLITMFIIDVIMLMAKPRTLVPMRDPDIEPDEDEDE